MEIHLSAQQSAAKEAYEEAGVIGSLSPQEFNKYQHKKWGGKMQVQVFLLEVTEILHDWPEMYHRNRQIVPLKQAINMVQSEQKQSLEKLIQQIK